MNNDMFQVKPIDTYTGARYPSAHTTEPAGETFEERNRPLLFLVSLVLIVGITVGLVGCYLRSDYVPETPQPQPDGGPDGDGGDGDPPCTDGDLRCSDDWTLETCDDGSWVGQSCHDECSARGLEYYSVGCDADAEDPCQCEYGIVEGLMEECEPGDVICGDDGMAQICTDEWYWDLRSCDEICREEHGPEWSSAGCDESAEDPCQCRYDIIDGGPMFCEPGEAFCDGDTVRMVCGDGGEWTAEDCNALCLESGNPDVVSGSCEDDGGEAGCVCMAATPGSGGDS